MKNIREKIKIVLADREKFLHGRRNWLIGQETLSAGKCAENASSGGENKEKSHKIKENFIF